MSFSKIKRLILDLAMDFLERVSSREFKGRVFVYREKFVLCSKILGEILGSFLRFLGNVFGGILGTFLRFF